MPLFLFVMSGEFRGTSQIGFVGVVGAESESQARELLIEDDERIKNYVEGDSILECRQIADDGLAGVLLLEYWDC